MRETVPRPAWPPGRATIARPPGCAARGRWERLFHADLDLLALRQLVVLIGGRQQQQAADRGGGLRVLAIDRQGGQHVVDRAHAPSDVGVGAAEGRLISDQITPFQVDMVVAQAPQHRPARCQHQPGFGEQRVLAGRIAIARRRAGHIDEASVIDVVRIHQRRAGIGRIVGVLERGAVQLDPHRHFVRQSEQMAVERGPLRRIWPAGVHA
ncbi:hypothetical protein G6F63_014175 [Rhizopus arrhizus]|nr:hypothetical protein G6F63_014175 [Rhizopus arrhizus]